MVDRAKKKKTKVVAARKSASAVEVTEIERRLTGVEGEDCLNELAQLYEIAESEDMRIVADALQAIPRILTHHRRRLDKATRNDRESPQQSQLRTWLKSHLDAYFATLAQLAASSSQKGQACGVRLTMATVRDEAQELELSGRSPERGSDSVLSIRLQRLINEVLLSSSWSGHAVEVLMEEFAAHFADIRHYILRHLKHCSEQMRKVIESKVAGSVGVAAGTASAAVAGPPEIAAEENESHAAKRRRVLVLSSFGEAIEGRGLASEVLFVRALAMLKLAPTPVVKVCTGETHTENVEEDLYAPCGRPAHFFQREYRKLFQDAWVQLLSLNVPLDLCRPLLQLLPDRLIPYMGQPLMLADFYLQAFSSSSPATAVLSLSGLFLLLTRHGLGDPDTLTSSSGEYYSRLYCLLTKDTMMLKQRVRFQRLLSASLLSNMLPARFAAAFAKRCMRLAVTLCAEYGTVMWLMAVAYALVQKHHSHCSAMLQWRAHVEEDATSALASDAAGASPSLPSDPYDDTLPLTVVAEKAARSSLWEVQILRRHHVPAVSTLAKLFLEPFFKPSSKRLEPEDFLNQSPSFIYAQALKSGRRQLERFDVKGKSCPVSFKVEDVHSEQLRLVGWAATLSVEQRKVGANI